MWGETSASGVFVLLVCGQVTLSFGCVVALITGEGSLITMDALVCGQVTLLLGSVVALITGEGSLITVDALVCGQLAHVFGLIGALIAFMQHHLALWK